MNFQRNEGDRKVECIATSHKADFVSTKGRTDVGWAAAARGLSWWINKGPFSTIALETECSGLR